MQLNFDVKPAAGGVFVVSPTLHVLGRWIFGCKMLPYDWMKMALFQ